MPYQAVKEGRVLVRGLPPSCIPLEAPSHCNVGYLKDMLTAANSIVIEIPTASAIVANMDGINGNAPQPTAAAPTGSTSIVDKVSQVLTQMQCLLQVLPGIAKQDLPGMAMPPASTAVMAMGLDAAIPVLPTSCAAMATGPGTAMPLASSTAMPPAATTKAMNHVPLGKKGRKCKSRSGFASDDDTPCCVCNRRYNEPPSDEWLLCNRCKRWHHTRCGPQNGNGACFNCKK